MAAAPASSPPEQHDAQHGSEGRPPQVLLLFKGHPGVGKSTLARRVCADLGWPLLDKDDARDALHEAAAATPAADTTASAAARNNALSYDIMFRFAATQLALGLSAALDCPFARPALYDAAAALAARHGAELALVDCAAGDEAAWRARLERRAEADNAAGGNAAAAHKPQSWDAVQKLLRGYGGCWRWSTDGSRDVGRRRLAVDTTGASLAANARAVEAFVAELRQQARR